jgi:hypothetical protein
VTVSRQLVLWFSVKVPRVLPADEREAAPGQEIAEIGTSAVPVLFTNCIFAGFEEPGRLDASGRMRLNARWLNEVRVGKAS